MKRFEKKHLRSLLVILSVLVLVAIGSTAAYFSSKDMSTNRFAGIKLDITLTETNWDPTAGLEALPGDELEKNPQVTNNDKADGYIFLRVTVPCDAQMVEKDDGSPKGTVSDVLPLYKFMVRTGPETSEADESLTTAQRVDPHWTLVEDYPALVETQVGVGEDAFTARSLIYVYAYAQGGSLTPVEQDQITEPLFDRLLVWNFNESFEPRQSHSVLVEALGIQTDLPGVDPGQIDAVWALLKGEVGE